VNRQPGLDSHRERPRRPGWPIVLVVGLAAVVIGVVFAVLLSQRPPPDGAASNSATLSASASATPSASVDAEPTPTTSADPTAATDLTWTTAGTFGNDAGLSRVADVAATDGGLVAVGVQLDGYPPVLGPSPAHDGRVWSSTDGRLWEDVTPVDTFENVALGHLLARADGSLLLLGTRSAMLDGVLSPEIGHTAWTSSDGLTWTEGPSGLPDQSVVFALDSGGRGHVAHLSRSPSAQGTELWHSSDGVTWEQVYELSRGPFNVGAGEEGFVAVGQEYTDPLNPTPLVIASGDGVAWFESASAPPGAQVVAPLGGDWVLVSQGAASASAQTWFSTDGLDWTERGSVALEANVNGSGCGEYPNGIGSASARLFLSTRLSACSEGGVYVHGTLLTSRDGATWSAVGFERGTPGDFWSGAGVQAAIGVEDGIVLVGEEDGRATFWFGEGS
jgi:hypothetical protein